MDNKCLTSGQATVCIKEEGILFSVNLVFSKQEKIIPFNNIKKVSLGPKWWIFPVFDILTKDDNRDFILEPGRNTGFSFKPVSYTHLTLPTIYSV